MARKTGNYAVGGARQFSGPGYEAGAPREPEIGPPSSQQKAKAGPVRTWAQMSPAERDAIRRQLGTK
jgi:hypothetical protein